MVAIQSCNRQLQDIAILKDGTDSLIVLKMAELQVSGKTGRGIQGETPLWTYVSRQTSLEKPLDTRPGQNTI